MPYSLGERGSHGCDGWPVLNAATGEVVPGGCHDTREQALRHQRALTLNVPDAVRASVRVLAGAVRVGAPVLVDLDEPIGCGCETCASAGHSRVRAEREVQADFLPPPADAHQAAVTTAPFDTPFPVAEYPPADWFEDPTEWLDQYFADHGLDDGIQWLAVGDDGRVAGYWWTEGVCHVDNTATMQAGSHECWMPEPSPSGYARFHQSEVVTADGEPLRVGVVGNVGGHASPNASVQVASSTYADPNRQRLVVRAGDRPGRGGWVAGALVPGTTYGDVAMLRRSTMSGDWRWFHPDALNPRGGYDALGPTIVTRPGLAHAPRAQLIRIASADPAHPDLMTPGSPRLAELWPEPEPIYIDEVLEAAPESRRPSTIRARGQVRVRRGD